MPGGESWNFGMERGELSGEQYPGDFFFKVFVDSADFDGVFLFMKKFFETRGNYYFATYRLF